MENILSEEPVLSVKRNEQRHPEIFAQIKRRAEAKKAAENVPVYRAKIVNNVISGKPEEKTPVLKQSKEHVIDKNEKSNLASKPPEKNQDLNGKDVNPPPVQDLREIINQQKRKMKEREKLFASQDFGPARSEDSFHSFSSQELTGE